MQRMVPADIFWAPFSRIAQTPTLETYNAYNRGNKGASYRRKRRLKNEFAFFQT